MHRGGQEFESLILHQVEYNESLLVRFFFIVKGRDNKMASSAMHLAVAKKYLEKNKDKNFNYKKVMAGTLYPDAAKDKDKTHYTMSCRGNNLVTYLASKVSLYDFLVEYEVVESFELGWFIHLVTDYLFFAECFSEEYLLTHSYEEFRRDLYFAYDCLEKYLSEKYKMTIDDYESYPSEYHEGILYRDSILTKETIDSFIERVSSINIEDYINKIKEAKRNVLP